jgi:hypothetical protein
MPWGPIEMEVAIRTSSAERWIRAWKQIIDSLVAILARLPGKTEFDIEDGRIVRLALHGETNVSLVDAVELDVWWRAAPGARLDTDPPAPLSYRVGPTTADPLQRQSRSRVRGGKREPAPIRTNGQSLVSS